MTLLSEFVSKSNAASEVSYKHSRVKERDEVVSTPSQHEVNYL